MNAERPQTNAVKALGVFGAQEEAVAKGTDTLENWVYRVHLRPFCVHLRIQAFSLAAATVLSFSAAAEVTITDAWVRGTVPAQTSTGAYMKMKSTEDARIVAASSPAAKVVEIHEMSMNGATMEMRPVAALPLPAGKTVELKSGGYHVMLMGLAKPLGKDDVVPITFTVEGAGGKRTTVEVKATVVPLVMKTEQIQKR